MASVDDVMMLAFHAVAQRRKTAGFMKSVMHFNDDANC